MDTTFLTYREFADKEDHEKQDNARKTVSTNENIFFFIDLPLPSSNFSSCLFSLKTYINEKIHDVPSAI